MGEPRSAIHPDKLLKRSAQIGQWAGNRKKSSQHVVDVECVREDCGRRVRVVQRHGCANANGR